jgi:hypothetical protein
LPAVTESKYLVQATWDDVPHLDEKTKADLLSGMAPFQRDARTKGIPALGSGAIYPVPESDILVDPFVIPQFWRKAYGLDVGWNKTACIWGAIDPTIDCLYLYAEYYKGHAEPSTHATAIRARGEWIPGVIDPAARGRSQKDGEQLMANFLDLGLLLEPAVNAVEAGLWDVLDRLQTGRLKVFRTLQNFLAEYRLYRRDEKGHVVKKMDHAMDATRYLVVSGILRACCQPMAKQWANAIGSAGNGDPSIGY